MIIIVWFKFRRSFVSNNEQTCMQREESEKNKSDVSSSIVMEFEDLFFDLNADLPSYEFMKQLRKLQPCP